MSINQSIGSGTPTSSATRLDASESYHPSKHRLVDSPLPEYLAQDFFDAKGRDKEGRLIWRFHEETWWCWRDGAYRRTSLTVAETEIRRHLQTVFHRPIDERTHKPMKGSEPIRLAITGNAVRQVELAMRSLPGVLVQGHMPQWLDGRTGPNPAHVVAYQNGLLDADAFCRDEIKLGPHTPEWFSATVMPYEFALDGGHACPKWLRFLDQVFAGDAQNIGLLQQWFGYCMLPTNRFQKFLYLYGKPNSGKSTTLKLLEAVVGEDNVAASGFSQISERFGLEPLVHKLAVIFGDAHVTKNMDAMRAIERLKSVTGDDALQVDRKGVKALGKERLLGRITIAVNNPPMLPDHAGALKRRQMLLHFAETFDANPDVSLYGKLMAELPAIARWSLEGYKRLCRQGGFTVPERSEAILSRFNKLSSPVATFVQEWCSTGSVDDIDFREEKDELFEAFKRFLRANDQKKAADEFVYDIFCSQMYDLSAKIESGKKGPRGFQKPAFKGVRLKDEYRYAADDDDDETVSAPYPGISDLYPTGIHPLRVA